MSRDDEHEPHLTIAEAAERLHLSPRAVRKLVEAGLIDHRRLGLRGGKILLPLSGVEAYWRSTLKTGGRKPRRELKFLGRG